LSTINHTLSWYQQDKEKRKVSLKKVRRLHAAANRKTMSVNGKDAYMTQFDMVTTQFAFIGSAMILPQEIGLGTPSGNDTLLKMILPGLASFSLYIQAVSKSLYDAHCFSKHFSLL
jgi:hypothetical protein